ncbi:hypothetical protein [Lysobacter gummosus]|uniref:hypothetical protein n=1 Tax=Lysobacter gummosus TaxID=262324 RepID=UPI00364558E8
MRSPASAASTTPATKLAPTTALIAAPRPMARADERSAAAKSDSIWGANASRRLATPASETFRRPAPWAWLIAVRSDA